MGSLLSLPVNKGQVGDKGQVGGLSEASKRLRMSSSYNDENPRLIPGLPDEISLQILARLPRIYYLNVKMVSRSWKAAITGPEIYQVRKELGITEEWLYVLTKVGGHKLSWYALDPMSARWQRLPPMPNDVYEDEPWEGLSGLRLWHVMGTIIKFACIIKDWLGWSDALYQIPFCGCAIGAVDGCLYLLGGFSRASATKCVWRYDPCVNFWQKVSSMTTGRAFCKTSPLNNKLYVVGGVNRGRDGLIPLHSAEVYDPDTGLWTQVPSMPFSKAQIIPFAFISEVLKPVATGMTSYRGRLCVPQSVYSWPFFVDVGGEIYDPESNSWVDMPAGMGEGWPARRAGTKLSAVVNGELYSLDPPRSLDNCKIKIYDHQEDAWKVVIGSVPHDFTNSESPYLLAGFLGKLHVITKDVNNDTAVLQANLQNHMFSSAVTSSSPAADSTSQNVDTSVEAETDVWKVIASKNFGAAELINCQVLNI